MYLLKVELMIAFLKKFEKVTRIINASSAHFLKLGAVNIFFNTFAYNFQIPETFYKAI